SLPPAGKSVSAAPRARTMARSDDQVPRMERMPDIAGRVPTWRLSRPSPDRAANDRASKAAPSRTSVARDASALAFIAPELQQPAQGNFQSAMQIGGTGTTQIGGTAFDGSGNLYVTGGFVGTIVFNTTPPTTFVATADYDFYLAKFAPDGHCLW